MVETESEMTGSGGSILCFMLLKTALSVLTLPDPDFRLNNAFESLFSNPIVPFGGFLCGPTITNESLPTSFPVPRGTGHGCLAGQ